MKQVYLFKEGRKEDKSLLGGKGANLAEMTKLGLPVPPGFVITTATCLEYLKNNENFPRTLQKEYLLALKKVEKQTNTEFGNKDKPLLVAVRSGAPISMPGMMDTILNLGMNDEIAEGLAKKTQNPRFAYDSYRRFIQMFANVVLDISGEKFEHIIEEYKETKNYVQDVELSAEDWKNVIQKFKEIVTVPSDPKEQLRLAIEAVFRSWNSKRAQVYRKLNDISDSLGTAVNVQSMVFGNFGDTSGSGVAFSRNPSTGEKKYYGEFLNNAAGEDVVAGIRNPEQLDSIKRISNDLYNELCRQMDNLEIHFKNMQDIEFTIQEGKLYILQTRSGKRTGKAAVRIAVEMAKENLINEMEALMQVEPEQMNFFLHPSIDPKAKKTTLAIGLPASPGGAVGKIVFSADDAEKYVKEGHKVIMVRKETTPEDIHGMKASEAILTSFGGMTSHAAVVARGMGKPAITGCSELTINAQKETVYCQRTGKELKKFDTISLDGSLGEIYDGEIPLITSQSDDNFDQIIKWADHYRTLEIRANAETPEDTKTAVELGAEGIGLCRTEHMFFESERIDIMRSMILSNTLEERKEYLKVLFEFQKDDIKEIFNLMQGKDVTIRLLDPPLHEFLPQNDEEIEKLAKRINISAEEIKHRVEGLSEINPMLGFRGCRLPIVYPEILRMQIRAIIIAAIETEKKGLACYPEIMVPLVSTAREIKYIIDIIEATIFDIFNTTHKTIKYKIGSMMETPRACIRADQIAPSISFMSFGTNDLTQMTYGFSRDDVGRFVNEYIDNKLLNNDPFVSLDQVGVGSLIQQAIKRAKEYNETIHIGVCGEHGGDPKSIEFFHRNGFDYVSCSPFRIPIAKIAAAQASIKKIVNKKKSH